MLKIRYNLETGLLSGWTDIEAEFGDLQPREREDVAVLDIIKPDVSDYEELAFIKDGLAPSGKKPLQPVRDLATEIDELRAEIEKLKEDN